MNFYKINNVDNLCIESCFMDEHPYLNLKIKNIGDNELTDKQKNLLYVLYLDNYYNTSHINSNEFNDTIKMIVLEEYNRLYEESMIRDYPAVVSYLLSNSLINDLKHKDLVSIFGPYNKDFDKYYLSFINEDIVKQNSDIFNVLAFSRCFKYSDEFIDNNFSKFLYKDFRFSKKIFLNIQVQQPSFATLVKHIGEFDINHAISKLHLDATQIKELMLLNDIMGADL